MSALIDGNDAYQAVTIMRVDWDIFKGDEWVKALNVKRQSTLVMFKDGKEIDRLIAQTSSDVIEEMFAKAIAS